MSEKKSYNVAEFTLNDKTKGDKIIFNSLEDMEMAYKDIDNGNDIYIEKDGIITKLLHQMINTKVYEGSIAIGAKKKKGETIEGKE